ncbi:MAG: cache domain-containing protein [Phycisphaerae bacterium]
MRSWSLKNRILFSMFAVICVLSVSIGVLGYYIIQADILDRAQQQVRDTLKTAHSFYIGEIERIESAFNLVNLDKDISELRRRMRLHYLRKIDAADINKIPSVLVQAAFETGEGVGGTRIMPDSELLEIDPELFAATRIQIRPTYKAVPTDKTHLEAVAVKEYAMPILDEQGNITKVFYGGRIINRDYELVDKIKMLVFGNERYRSKPIGTVTIFQGDTRISTNVVDETGERAIGTRVSARVYEEVAVRGNIWDDRAFVVDSWYLTAYEPIKNIHGDIIGMLYVGTLAEPFDILARRILLAFIAIVTVSTIFAAVLSLILAERVSRLLSGLLNATKKLSEGDLGYSIAERTDVDELDKLAKSFNEMSTRLNEREQSLKITNEKLEAANKSYIDLIGFVAHELKGILASAIMNAYAVRDGLLGLVNFKQRKALDSITRNMDYLDATVKKFLNLGRIEKGDIEVHKTEINLNKDVFKSAIDALKTSAARRHIRIDNKLDDNIEVLADADLMQVVANNLVGNAIKYGIDGGEISLKSFVDENKVKVEVYNDSVPITKEQKEKLFKKFSRLQTPETKKVKGTGLGLYITRQIIEKHGGSIWVEPREKGNSFIFEIERN